MTSGVGIKGDCTRLADFYGEQVAWVVDLRSLAVARKVEVRVGGLVRPPSRSLLAQGSLSQDF